MVPLSPEAWNDLQLWAQNFHLVNGQTVQRLQPSLVITSDTSLAGWGACSQGVEIGGPWKPGEGHLHLNYLELLAATLATKAFMKNLDNVVINLKIDNASAVAYITLWWNTLRYSVLPRQGAVGMVSREGMPCDSN